MSWKFGLLASLLIGGCTGSPRVSDPLVKSLETGAASAAESVPVAFARPEGQLTEGVNYRRLQREGDPALVAHILEIDLTEPRFRFALTPGDRSKGMEHTARLTSEVLDTANAVVAVNASYFLPFAGGSPGGDDYYPKIGDPVNVSGAEMSAGETQSPVETDLDIRVNAIVCFSGLRVDIADGQVCPQGHTDGVAAGPRLLAAGQRRSFRTFDNNYAVMRHPRSAMGVTADRRRAWIVVVDGRQKGYSDGATLDELTDLFVSLGAAEAINLDGGGSSTLVVEDEAGAAVILNRPIHTGVPGRERPVANQILLVAAGD